ncbi:hypothetical protein HG531_009423 [Fusarium graminearum]|nr:hypothetical protein HG531_009423 [Fusarium graminearum]
MMDLNNIPKTYSSERLIYRALENNEQDTAYIFKFHENDPFNTALSDHSLLRPRNKKSSEDLITAIQKASLSVMVCLSPSEAQAQDIESSDPVPIGFAILGWGGIPAGREHHRSTSLGITLSDPYQGKGYGSEVINWLLDWAFRDLANDRVADRTNSCVEDNLPYKHNTCLSKAYGLALGNTGENTNEEHENCAHTAGPDVQCSATNAINESPRDDDTNRCETKSACRELERVLSIDTGLDEEVGWRATDTNTSGVLRDKYETDDLSSAQVDTLETVEVARASAMFALDLVGMHDHGKLLVKILVGLATLGRDSSKDLLCVFETVLSCKPVGRFGSEPQNNQERDRPDPLDCKRDTVCPFCSIVGETKQNTSGEKLAESPA